MSINSTTIRRKERAHTLQLGVDVPLLIGTITLLIIGLIFVYSSSWEFAVQQDYEPSYFLKRQLLFAGIGSVGAVIAFLVDYRRLRKLIPWMVVFTLLLLLFVSVIFGEFRLGARRALYQGSIQPSELAKLVIILYLAFWLNAKQKYLNTRSWALLPLMLVVGAFCGLIFIQPDLSATVTVFVLGILMFFLGGADLDQIWKLALIAVIAGIFALIFSSTAQNRIGEFLSGLRDPAEGSYHVIRAIEGIVKGGLFGVGIGKSTVKFTGLPFAPTDSIFAVIAEEKGLLGAITVVLLYLIILWRGVHISNRAPDRIGKLIASGIAFWILLEAIINIGVMVNLLPFAGNALPLISYGGSSLVTVMTGLGLMMGVARVNSIKMDEQEGRPLNAVVDLRGDDGWRSVSRSRRSASHEN